MSYLNRKFTWDFDSLKVFFLNYVLSPLLSLVGYYECATAASQAAKTVTASWYNKIREGGSMKIKFTHMNTAASGVTLKIGSAAAKPLYYEGAPVDATNTWDDGETVEVYFDGTSYYANNVKGGSGSGDGAFDVSVKYPTSGVEGGNTYTLEGALAVLNANLSANKKKGGMSIKFIQSSDNKYVQFRYMLEYENTTAGNQAFMNAVNWQGVTDEVKFGGKDIIVSGSVYEELYGNIQKESIIALKPLYAEHLAFSKVIPAGAVIDSRKTPAGAIVYLAKTDWTFDSNIELNNITLPYTTQYDYIGVLSDKVGSIELNYHIGEKKEGIIGDINDEEIRAKAAETLLQQNLNTMQGVVAGIQGNVVEIQNELTEDVEVVVPHTYNMVGQYNQATMFETPLPAGTVIKSMSGIASFYFTDANGTYHTPLINTSQRNLVLSQTEYGVISNSSGTLTLNIVETIKKQKTEIIDEEIAVINTNIEDIQSELLGEIDIICPTNLYAMVGKDFNLYYDSLFKAMDNGLQSPFGYYVEINCATLWTKSIRKDRCWQIQGNELTSASIGQHSATINVYNHKGELSGTKNVTINVIDNQGLANSKNILLIGDSLTYNGSLAKRVNNSIVALGGDTPNMIGTVLREGYYSEGRPGWTAIDFVSAKQNGYHIFFVTISANVNVGDKYTDGTTQYIVADIRIEGDTKSLRCTGSAEPSSTTGTLTKVSGDGDSSITYSNYIHENGNPLYNNTTELIDFTNYREIINLGSQFDVIVIMLGVNDCLGGGNLQNSVAAIKTLTEKALEDSPNCKVIVELTTLDANTVSSWQAYGSLASKHHYQERVWQLRQLLMDETFAANVMIGTCGLSIDRYYGYPYSTAQCSQRITETEILHTNCVHPSNAGYNQIADCYVAEILS